MLSKSVVYSPKYITRNNVLDKRKVYNDQKSRNSLTAQGRFNATLKDTIPKFDKHSPINEDKVITKVVSTS